MTAVIVFKTNLVSYRCIKKTNGPSFIFHYTLINVMVYITGSFFALIDFDGSSKKNCGPAIPLTFPETGRYIQSFLCKCP